MSAFLLQCEGEELKTFAKTHSTMTHSKKKKRKEASDHYLFF